MTDRVIPCLWFNDKAEEAINFYVDVFPDSRITKVHRYGEAGPGKPGSVMMIWFELGGRSFSALNGGVDFPFSEAVSLVYPCDGQAEIDRVWDRLAEGGTPQQCGWIKDRYGLPWQIVPSAFEKLMSGDPAASNRVMTALFGMVKIDLPTLERARAG